MISQGNAGGQAAVKEYERARVTSLVLLAIFALFAVLPQLLFGGRANDALTVYMLIRQDALLVPLFLFAMLLKLQSGDRLSFGSQRSSLTLCLSIALILTVGWAGHYLVFQEYDLSRDEQMAVFDQQIFANGRLFWWIPSEWRPMAEALNRRFMLAIPDDQFWVSAYLPIHSAFRALVSRVMDPAWASPILGSGAAISLWIIARKIWPSSPRTATIALVLLITSSQFLITAMTSFSMTMHLTFNLIWLALFLRDRWYSHAAATLVGFFATGIHQPLFHPLFVMPFLILLVTERRFWLAAWYTIAYALVGLFWMWWPVWISSHASEAALAMECAVQNCSSGVGFVDRIAAVLGQRNVLQHFSFTGENMLRFVVWQHPLLVPLALFGAINCWRSERIVSALAVGFVLPIMVIAVVLPWQGHGWGYRYLHPVLGNAILLACFGLKKLESGDMSARRALAITTAGAIILLPVHAWMAARLTAPFVQTRNELLSIPADIVIVDGGTVPLGEDMVLNRFDLTHRPVLLQASLVSAEDLRKSCSHHSIGFYDAPRLSKISALFMWKDPTEPSKKATELRMVAKRSGCRIVENRPVEN